MKEQNGTENLLVEIEFKRVQTFLFASSTLKSMVGANTILGETLRGVWKNKKFERFIETDKRDDFVSIGLTADNIPGLCQELGSSLPEKFNNDGLSDLQDTVSKHKKNDPFYLDEEYQDDVIDVALNSGILVRDGGHFEAIFTSSENVECFKEQLAVLISFKLPGVIFEFRCKQIEEFQGKLFVPKETQPDVKMNSCALLDLPQFNLCQVTGMDPAAQKIKFNTDEKIVSQQIFDKIQAAKRFKETRSYDVLGIFKRKLLKGQNEKYNFPEEFSDLCSGSERFMAVIHADGNSIGKRLKNLLSSKNDEKEVTCLIEDWVLRESLFYKIRSGVRKALLEAFEKVYSSKDEQIKPELIYKRNHIVKFLPLMLGGDDILIALPASIAFEFIKELSQMVQDILLPDNHSNNESPLTLGIGMVICHAAFPFYKAHELAEELASSAKKLKTSFPRKSYVDWLVISESWHAGIQVTRNKNCVSLVNGKRHILTGKPYVVSNKTDQEAKYPCLDDMIELSHKVKNEEVARNQLKYIYEKLPEGRNICKVIFSELPEKYRHELSKNKKLFTAEPFIDVDENTCLTYFGDFIEVLETGLCREES